MSHLNLDDLYDLHTIPDRLLTVIYDAYDNAKLCKLKGQTKNLLPQASFQEISDLIASEQAKFPPAYRNTLFRRLQEWCDNDWDSL